MGDLRGILLLFCSLHGGNSILLSNGPIGCRKCQGEEHFSHCPIQICHYQTDKCFVIQVMTNGTIEYYSGCVPDQVCNNHTLIKHIPRHGHELCSGCSPQHSYHISLNDICPPQIECVVCNGQGTLDECKAYITCSDKKKCYIQQVEVNGEIRLYAGCQTDQWCNDPLLHTREKYGGSTVCAKCCANQTQCSLNELCPAVPAQCLKCIGQPSIADCRQSEICSAGQKCYVKTVEFSGLVEYYAGCTNNENCYGNNYIATDYLRGIPLCSKCCPDHSQCSLGSLCPAVQPARCVSCHGVESLTACTTLEICRIGQKCYVNQEQDASGKVKYYAGCASELQCKGTVPWFSHGGTRLCAKCCTDHKHCSLSTLCPQKEISCIHCHGEKTLSMCHQSSCAQGEKCYVRQEEYSDGVKYFAGCTSDQYCHGDQYTGVERHGGTPLCSKCCANHAHCSLSDLCPPVPRTCLACNGEDSISKCTRQETCIDSEKCYVNQVEVGGKIQYYAGCTYEGFCHGTSYQTINHRGGVTLCGKCCTNHSQCSLSDLCPPSPKMCLQCNGEDSLTKCSTYQNCIDGQKCLVQKTEDHGKIRYYAGCTSDLFCHGTTSAKLNTHGGKQLCAKYCANHSQCLLSDFCPQTKCLRCNGEESIDACSNFDTCSDGQQCQGSAFVPLSNYGGIELCAQCCFDHANCSLAALCPPVTPPVKCLTCEGEHLLGSCTNYTTCAHGQKCFVNQVEVLGKVKYYAGCANEQQCHSNSYSGPSHNGTQLCAKCCPGDANCPLSDLCPPVATTCLSCNGEESIADCKNYSPCQDAERCFVKQVKKGGKIKYYSGCTSDLFCLGTHYTALNHHGGTQLCAKCCPNQLHCSLAGLCPPDALTCVKCNGESVLKNCQDHETCRNDEKCFVRKIEVQGKTEYYSGCVRNSLCNGTNYTPANNYGGTNLCHKCCADNSSCSLKDLCPETLQASRNCYICSGQGCEGHVGLTECGDPSDLCMTSIDNRQDGTQIYSKKCATVNECDDKWLKVTALKPECIGFHPDSSYKFNFNCTFCCKTDGCNSDHIPDVDSLYLVG